MRLVSSLLCGACVALLAASPAASGTLIPVPAFPGATTTNVSDINDNLEIAGSYIDAGGIEHGFFGTLGGDYTSFDYPGASSGTEARSINDQGYVLGYAPDETFVGGPEFLRKPNGTFVTIMKDGVPLSGIAQGLAAHQISTGDYIVTDAAHKVGYRGKNGKYKEDIDLGLSGVTRVSGREINGHGDMAGFFVDSGGDHGFIIKNGTTTVIDADDSGTTTLEGLNEKGIATGQVLSGEDMNTHAFVLNTHTGTFTWIDVPGSTNQQAWGINKQGLVAVSSDNGSYIYCPLKPRRCPSGGTEIHERKTHLTSQRVTPHVHREARHGAAR